MALSPETRLLLRSACFLAAALPISWIDLRTRRIPDLLSLGGLGVLLLIDLIINPIGIPAALAGAAFAFFVFWLVRWLTRGLGLGDVKYAALLGYFAGIRLLPVAFLAAAGTGLAFVAVARLFLGMPKDARVAFGPFLSAGGIAAAIYLLI
jgi:prepilin signal peptidase PulO-like enzyme (type II secretory pathway)